MSDNPHDPPCTDLVELRARFDNLTTDVSQNQVDIRNLLDFAAGLKMLLNLSIGGGALSILNLIILLVTLALNILQ